MSEATTTDAPASTTFGVNGMRAAVATGLVAAVVGGAALLPTPERAPYAEAADLIGQAYADGDGDAFVSQWDDRFTDQFEDRDGLVQDVDGLLLSGARVVDEQLAIVRGVPLVVVTTEDNIRWCVRPDGKVLPTCLLGDVRARVDASGLQATGGFIGGAVNLDRAEVVVELTGTSEDPVKIPAGAMLVGDTGRWSLAQVQQTAGGQPFPTNEDGSYDLGGPFGVTLVFTAELGGAGAWDPITLTWSTARGDVDVTIPQPSYWLR